jgi:hypothetical protein
VLIAAMREPEGCSDALRTLRTSGVRPLSFSMLTRSSVGSKALLFFGFVMNSAIS